jgi:beta-glucanase (GH16 family)
MKNFPRLFVGFACALSALVVGSHAGAATPTYASPDHAVLTAISGIDGSSINDTANAIGWINTYYSPTDRLLETYVDAGSAITLTWQVSGPSGSPLANTAVTLGDNLAYSNSNGTTWGAATLNDNPNTATAPNSFLGGTLAGVTNASGQVTFTIANTNTSTGTRPNDLITTAGAEANEGVYPWSRFYLVVGSDGITDTNLAKVTQATDLVDLIVIPSTTLSGLTPTFASPTPTTSGFLTQITNYSATSTWQATVSPSGTATVSSTGLVTVTGVASGTSATVTVTSRRAGYANASASVTAVAIASGAPAAPSVNVTVSSASLIASWSAPSSGNSALLSYDVKVTDATGTIVAEKILKAALTSFKVSGLTNGSSYSVSVVATNANRISSAVGVVSNVIPLATVEVIAKKVTAVFGDAMTLSATVGAATSGSVRFADGTLTLCVATVSNDSAICTSTTQLDAGTYSVTATYSGNTSTRAAVCATSLVVNQAVPQLTLTPSSSTLTPSQLGSFTLTDAATATGGAIAPGSLSLMLDGQTLCTSAGVCSVKASGISSIAVGNHILVLSYPGSTNFKPGLKKFVLVVTKDAPVTSTTTTTVPATTTTTTVPVVTTTTTTPVTTTTSAGTSLTPILSASTSTIGGFTTVITNYNAAFTFSATTNSTAAASVSSSGLVSVSGLAPGASTTVTVTASCSGSPTKSASSSGTSISDTPSVASPDRAVLTSTTGTYGAQIDDTANGLTYFINAYYNNTDHWYLNYLVARSTATLTWHVTGANGQALAFEPVTMLDNLAYSSATGSTWSVSSLNTNPGGTLSGVTDANGNVTLSMTNINSPSGSTPSDITSIAAAQTNEGVYPWTCLVLVVGTDTFTGNPSADVNLATDRVDFIIVPGTSGPAPQATLAVSNSLLTNRVGTVVTVTTSGGSGSGTLSYAVTGTGCSLSQNTITAASATTCVVTATKAASAGFQSATSASVTFSFVSPTTPTFTNPDVATLTAITGTVGSIIDDTPNGQSWFINAYFQSSDTYGYAYVNAGSTVTMTWHVTGPTGLALANKPVTLIDNLANSNSSGTSWSVSNLNTNPTGTLAGTTDANGNVTFTLTNANANTGTRPSDLTTNTAAHSNESIDPWTRVLLQVGADVFSASPNTTVNQSTSLVDLIVIPTASTVINYDTTPAGPLLWSETFTGTAGTAIPSSIWTPEIGQYVGVANGLPNWPYGTGEIENNTANPANVSLDGNGNLAITAKCTSNCSSNGNWTSARISTAGKANFLYGQLEARIKVPSGPFNWPAFWMLGQNFFTGTNWPNCGEVDIMEGLANNTVDQATLHANYPGGGDWNGGGGITMGVSPVSSLSGGYHTFGLLWSPNQIQFTLDGNVYGSDTYNASAGTVTQRIGTSTSTFTIGGQVWPFNQPFFLILQDAIPGGTSAPDGSSGTMSVSWIKYYSYNGYGAVTP